MITIISGIKKLSTDNLEYLESFSKVRFKEIKGQKSLRDALQECDIFWFRLNHKLTRDILLQARCRFIVCAATGLDHIDIKTCTERGIEIVSLFSEKEFLKEIRATAEHTLGLLLALIRHTPKAFYHTKDGMWKRNLFLGNELYKKKIGVYGLGRLGLIVAGYYKALGMEVYYYDIDDTINNASFIQIKSEQKFLETVDYLSIHIPLNADNTNCLNKNNLQFLKKTAIIVNTSRGGVIDEEYILYLLKNGFLGGYATDVLKGEPEIADNPLINYSKENDNVIITPHIGGYTEESIEKTEKFVLQKLHKLILT